MTGPALYQSLRDIKLTTVRRAISSGCYRRSALQTFGWFGFDLSLYLGALWGVFVSESAWAKLAFGVGAGCAVAFMFVWAHDAAHGALFRRRVDGGAPGHRLHAPLYEHVPALVHGHNRVHHGFTSYTPVDWVWRPLTPEAYAAKSRWGRAGVPPGAKSDHLCAALSAARLVAWNGDVSAGHALA